jgi:hypothetical protein
MIKGLEAFPCLLAGRSKADKESNCYLGAKVPAEGLPEEKK